MWERDKLLVAKYRDCMNTFISELKAGEEPDWENSCGVEAARILKHVAVS